MDPKQWDLQKVTVVKEQRQAQTKWRISHPVHIPNPEMKRSYKTRNEYAEKLMGADATTDPDCDRVEFTETPRDTAGEMVLFNRK